jgi:hypothetical protein
MKPFFRYWARPEIVKMGRGGLPPFHIGFPNRLYRGLDRLLEKREELEAFLKERLGGLFTKFD